MNLEKIYQELATVGAQFALKLLGALAIWIVGRWLISLAIRMISRALSAQKLDATVMGYVRSTISVLLTITLVVAILGFFGVQPPPSPRSSPPPGSLSAPPGAACSPTSPPAPSPSSSGRSKSAT